MKRLLIASLLLSSPVWADNADKAFVTGFANALNRSMGGNPNDSRPQPSQEVEVYHAPQRMINVVVAMREDGSEGPEFFTYSACSQFVRNTGGFRTCSVVSKPN